MAIQVQEIERRTDVAGKTLYLMIKSGSRSRQHKFFEPDEVPDFEGESAWFEVEPRGGRAHWKVLRQVPPPAVNPDVGLRDAYPHVMAWMSTLGAMKEAGTCVRASCQSCGKWHDVDLDQMIRELGSPDASLWDRYPPCLDEACKGLLMFTASPGTGTPFRPLISPDVPSSTPLPIEALMDGWIGRRPHRRSDPRGGT